MEDNKRLFHDFLLKDFGKKNSVSTLELILGHVDLSFV